VPAGWPASAPPQQPKASSIERFPLPEAYTMRPSGKPKDGVPFLHIISCQQNFRIITMML
jgi:hypothetical protein